MIENITIDGSRDWLNGNRKAHWLMICDGGNVYLPASEFEIVTRMAFHYGLCSGWLSADLIRGDMSGRYIYRIRQHLKEQGIEGLIETGYLNYRLIVNQVQIRRRIREFSPEFESAFDRMARLRGNENLITFHRDIMSHDDHSKRKEAVWVS